MVVVRPDVDLSIVLNQRMRSSSDNTLSKFRMLFSIESVFGVQRLSSVRGIVGPPSLISQLYSVALACCLLYFSLSHLVPILVSKPVTDAVSLSMFTFYVYRISIIIMHFAVVFKTVFLDSAKTVVLFQILRDMDDEMNLPANHKIYDSISLRNKVIFITILASYAILAFLWTNAGFFLKEEWYLISLMGLFELELMLCGSFLSCLQVRVRHITGHINHQYSLQAVASNPPISLMTWSWFVHNINSETATFELNLTTVFKLYDKLLHAFDLVNSLFNLQIFLFYFINVISIMMSFFGFITTSQSQSFTFEIYLAICLWWLRMAVSICYPCIFAEGLTMAVEELQSVLLALLGDDLHQEHHKAATSLLRYCELSQPRFNVYNLFCMDIRLPFNYVTLVVTYLIVLLQFKFS